MGRKKNNSFLGCLFLLLLAASVVIGVAQQNPVLGIATGVGLILVLGAIIYLLRPRRCGICGNVLQRKSYRWEIDGVKRKVCPHCNQTLARRQSREATRRFR